MRQEIFLIEVNIAESHIDNMEVLEPRLLEGVEVKFFREPNNKYDRKAIIVKDKEKIYRKLLDHFTMSQC